MRDLCKSISAHYSAFITAYLCPTKYKKKKKKILQFIYTFDCKQIGAGCCYFFFLTSYFTHSKEIKQGEGNHDRDGIVLSRECEIPNCAAYLMSSFSLTTLGMGDWSLCASTHHKGPLCSFTACIYDTVLHACGQPPAQPAINLPVSPD